MIGSEEKLLGKDEIKHTNIYLVVEDHESFCIMAKTMGHAVSICEANYLAEREKENDYDYEQEKYYYHAEILESCALVGRLKN